MILTPSENAGEALYATVVKLLIVDFAQTVFERMKARLRKAAQLRGTDRYIQCVSSIP